MTQAGMKRARVLLLLGVVAAIFSGCDLQRTLLYYPGNVTLADVQRYAANNGLRMWPDGTAGYRGIVSRNGPENCRGTIIIFHGNAGAAVSRDYYIAALEARGYRVVLAEYPGYGGRPGELSEKSLVADARRAVLLAGKEFGDPLYVWGESMGCGVASALAADTELRLHGVVMLTPWDSLLNEARARFPWLPVTFFLHDTYDNVTNLAHYKGPVAVIMARRDTIIPNRLTESLYTALRKPKRLWIFEDAGHNDWPIHPQLEWWSEVMTFLTDHAASR